MERSSFYTVITGDIVRSAELSSHRDEALAKVEEVLACAVSLWKKDDPVLAFTGIYRGDSFQGVVADAATALKVALFIRAELISERQVERKLDVRMALGIGTIDHLDAARIERSDGEAFRMSGRSLDGIKGYRRLSIVSTWPDLNGELQVMASLLDAVISRWTAEQAEVVSLWLQGKRQESMAGQLGISQPAVQQRLRGAGTYALQDVLHHLEQSVGNYKELGL